MPTTYAHDLFGRKVYAHLPEELKGVVMRHKNAYLIGLHGPDILFYYQPFRDNKVNQTGHRLHEEEAAGFFIHCRQRYRETGDEAVLAYTMGFVCHFMLDSTCHPYIYSYTERTGASHAEIETELDRTLMENNGKNPFTCRPARVIRGDRQTVQAIASVFDGISEKQIRRALRGMKFYTGFLVCRRRSLKRGFLLKVMRLLGVYEETQGRIMRRRPSGRCEESTRELLRLGKCAIPETVTILEEFCQTSDDPQALSYRFARNYK